MTIVRSHQQLRKKRRKAGKVRNRKARQVRFRKKIKVQDAS